MKTVPLLPPADSKLLDIVDSKKYSPEFSENYNDLIMIRKDDDLDYVIPLDM